MRTALVCSAGRGVVLLLIFRKEFILMKLLKFKKSFALTALTAIAIFAVGGTAASAAGTWSEDFSNVTSESAASWWDSSISARNITYSIDNGEMLITNKAGKQTGVISSKKIADVTATGRLTIKGEMLGLSRIGNDNDQYDHILAFRNGDDVIFSLKFNNGTKSAYGRYKVFAAGPDGVYKLLVDSNKEQPKDFTTDFMFEADVDLISDKVTVSIDLGDDGIYTCEPFSYTVDSIDDLIMDATIGSSASNDASTLKLDDLSVTGEDTEKPATKSNRWTFNAPLSQMNEMSLYVDYTEGENAEQKIKSLADLGWETTVSGGGDANLAITFTDIPEDVEITSVTIK